VVRPRPRVTPNLFGICFGVAGVAEAWSAASDLFGVRSVVADALWLAVAVLWTLTTVAYLNDVARGARCRTELLDPVFAPFTALVLIVPMLLGVALASHAHTPGVVVFGIALAGTVLLGGWLTGQWILSELTLAQWHPGYFLPTVAGGLLASAASAELGYASLARVMFGYGAICWLVLGSILLQRLFTQPRLPVPLLPTMAIEVAPPVVAGIAWFAINGGRADGVAFALAGYAALMVLVQLRLVTAYRGVPFGPGWWAFAFSYAAVFVDAIRWVGAEHAPHGTAWTYLLLAVVSFAALALLARTGLALVRRRFLPAPPKGQ
jgi:tellurite resistance protein